MATPSEKSPEMERTLEALYGRTSAIQGDRCAACGASATTFRDELSAREYRISGLCQRCQDKVYVPE